MVPFDRLGMVSYYCPIVTLTLLVGPVKITGCWFVGGDDLTGALHDLWLQ